MTEKKYETASEFINGRLYFDYDSIDNINDIINAKIELDKQFINKDKLRDDIMKLCCHEYEGLVTVSDDIRKILKLLDE